MILFSKVPRPIDLSFMKNLLIFIALTSFAFAGAAQNTPTKRRIAKTATAKIADAGQEDFDNRKETDTCKKDDNGDLEKALAMERPDDKIAALMKFLVDHHNPLSGRVPLNR